MAERRAVHQLVHTLSYGDAISSEVLSLQRVFHEAGYESEIFSLHTHPKLKGRSKELTEFPNEFSGEVLLHYSLGSPLNDRYRSLTSATRSIIYHNLTPSRWFEGVNPRIVENIRQGEEELPELLAISDRVIADSTFNADELRSHGVDPIVLPLPIDPARWSHEPNEGITRILRSQPGPHLLHVGRFAPNKCLEDVIRAFYFYRRYIAPQSRLWLVGIEIDTELYAFSIRYLVEQLGLRDAVEFPGCLADSELRSLYEGADLYLCMSEHEGFCLPVIEAMHFGLPVVAYSSSALPETIGEGGVLVNSKEPAHLAVLFDEILRSSDLRSKLVIAGRSRVAELSYDTFAARALEVFMSQGDKHARCA
ncbi:MAG: glycosyltransferase [Bdellovibrionales bacterium]|nr:glycosyltransferase [Bdellovibrionales bacterium]